MGLERLMGVSTDRPRRKNDFYPTPPDVTRALLDAVRTWGSVWEPACGDGAMARVIEGYGYTVIGTDLHPQGYGETADFLAIEKLLGMNIITNPPFSLAEQFIRHALALKPFMVAMLLKAHFWHAARRRQLFEESCPYAVYPLTWRPDFLKLGGPMMDVQWTVWVMDHCGPTQYLPLPKPRTELNA